MTRDTVTRALTDEAREYARLYVTPLYKGGEQPTPYETALLAQVAATFKAGAEWALDRAGLLAASAQEAREQAFDEAISVIKGNMFDEKGGAWLNGPRVVLIALEALRKEAAAARAPHEGTSPIVERGWALRNVRRLDGRTDLFMSAVSSQHRAPIQFAVIFSAREKAELFAGEDGNWEPVYVTRAVSVTISPEEPAEERP